MVPAALRAAEDVGEVVVVDAVVDVDDRVDADSAGSEGMSMDPQAAPTSAAATPTTRRGTRLMG